MKFQFGSIPLNPGFEPAADGWYRLKEPTPWRFVALGFLVGLVAASLVVTAWRAVGGVRITEFSVGLSALALLALILLPLHELVHALCHPGGGLSQATVFGFSARLCVFYIHYDGVLKRNRLILILLAPFTLISMAPLIASWASRQTHGVIIAVSVLNALAAGGDLALLLLIAWQVPCNGQVRNQGYDTWWKA